MEREALVWMKTGCAALRAGVLSGAVLLGFSVPVHAQTPTDTVFTIANYPVEATAGNAVEAKERAMADGQRAAFRSLLKRLVPVTAYNRLKPLTSNPVAGLVESVAIRSETNSRTRYIASLDFAFSPRGVRDLLAGAGVPYIEVQSQPVVVVPAIRGAGGLDVRQSREWLDIWGGLDLEHALSPIRLARYTGATSPDALEKLAGGDAAAMRELAVAQRSDRAVALVAVIDRTNKRLEVSLAGQDAVGPLALKRRYAIPDGDVAYAMEYAAVVSLAIIEGRWKAVQAARRGGIAALSAPAEAVEIIVEFRNRQQWEEVRRQLGGLPGMQALDVRSLSARSAVLDLRYPGGGPQLASALAGGGFTLANIAGVWTLRPIY